MNKSATLIIYVVLMIIVIVAGDLLFFRHRFRARLIANIAIVLAFLIVYLMFLRQK
jgi:hypothetical protein